MIKLPEFTMTVWEVKPSGKGFKLSGNTVRNPNAGKKDDNGEWVKTKTEDWVKSYWNVYVYDQNAGKIESGDKITFKEGAVLTHELWEHEGKKDYPIKISVRKEQWSWKSKAKDNKTSSKPKQEEVEDDDPPF